MADKLHFSLVSPERELFSGMVDQVDASGGEGDFAVLAHHAPFMTALKEGPVSVKDGGKVHVYRRDNSSRWQCVTYLAGKNRRVSTHEDSLAKAKDFAEDWYLELKGKHRAGQLKDSKTFVAAAEKFSGGVRSPFTIITGGAA